MTGRKGWHRTLAIGAALFVFVAVGPPAQAFTSEQIWVDYNPSRSISKNARLFGDVGLRGDLERSGWWRVVVRPSAMVTLGRIKFAAGIGNFFTFTDIIADRWEVRPYQGVSVVWPNRRVAFDHYVRLEERFDFNMETWNSLNSLRLRYWLRGTYRWPATPEDKYWALTASVEAFWHLTGYEGLQREQGRVTAGIERGFSHHRRIRLELSLQQQSAIFRPNETIDDIYLRLRLYQRW
jgi:hypothetical protein